MAEIPDELRERAVERLRKKRELATHALVYLLVNGFLVVIWFVTDSGFFWPVFPLAGWGIGLALHAWDVWRGEEFTEAQVARELDRLRQRGPVVPPPRRTSEDPQEPGRPGAPGVTWQPGEPHER